MDREIFGADTGKIELQKIINCLKENNYVFEDLEEATMEGSIVANLKKEINYSDEDGNYINDRYIRIKIEFDSDFDYKNKNGYKDSDGEFLFDNDKGTEFIQKLFSNTYGGSRKRIIKRKKNTRRIRKK